MISFKPSFEVASYEDKSYINKEGIYRGKIINAFYATRQNGSDNNGFVFLTFKDSATGAIANLNLFVEKNGNFEYVNKSGKKEAYMGFRVLNAIMILLGIDEFKERRRYKEQVFGVEQEVSDLADFYPKEICFGLNAEEFIKKNGEVGVRMSIERVFNTRCQSSREFQNNQAPRDYQSFKPKYIRLETNSAQGFTQNVAQNFTPNAKQSFDPYANVARTQANNQSLFAEEKLKEVNIDLEANDNNEMPF